MCEELNTSLNENTSNKMSSIFSWDKTIKICMPLKLSFWLISLGGCMTFTCISLGLGVKSRVIVH